MKDRLNISGADLATDWVAVEKLYTTWGPVDLTGKSYYTKRNPQGIDVASQGLWRRGEFQLGDSCWLEEVTDAEQTALGKAEWDRTTDVEGVGV